MSQEKRDGVNEGDVGLLTFVCLVCHAYSWRAKDLELSGEDEDAVCFTCFWRELFGGPVDRVFLYTGRSARLWMPSGSSLDVTAVARRATGEGFYALTADNSVIELPVDTKLPAA